MEKKKGNIIGIIVCIVMLLAVLVMLLAVLVIAIPSMIKSWQVPGESNAASTLKTLYGMMHTSWKKGYANIGNTFPVGNDPHIKNNGKFCGLYYEVDNAGERVTFIGVAEAAADFRAGSEMSSETGEYVPSIKKGDTVEYLPAVTFEKAPRTGYWYALMKYYNDGENLIPYDKEFSKNHFALVAFPVKYGKAGTFTFIINEEGTLYRKDFGRTGYIDTYPGPDPVEHGWERQ